MRRVAVLCAALALLVSSGSRVRGADPEPGSRMAGKAFQGACSLIENASGVPLVHLDAAAIDGTADSTVLAGYAAETGARARDRLPPDGEADPEGRDHRLRGGWPLAGASLKKKFIIQFCCPDP